MTATRNLTMVRGDTMAFKVQFPDLDCSTIVSLYFTVKKRARDALYIFQEALGDGITQMDDNTYHVRIAPEDTADMQPGQYVYDLQVGVGDDIYTPMMGALTLVQDITLEV